MGGDRECDAPAAGERARAALVPLGDAYYLWWGRGDKAGNPRPRVFHLPADGALINRYGFPSQGHTSLLSRLRARVSGTDASPAAARPSPRLLSVNLGKNKSSPPESIDDFLAGIRTFAPFARVLVINVSSPNTPGLRALQGRGLLETLLDHATRERDAVAAASSGRRARLVLKIAPDLSEDAVRDLAEVVRARGVDGVIVSNTTVQRPEGLVSRASSAPESQLAFEGLT